VSAPAHGWADIRLLAEVLHWRLWTDPDGITDENLAAGPSHANDQESGEALAVLLRAIRDLPLGQTPVALASSTAPPDTGTSKLRADYLASDWHSIHSVFHADWDRPENTNDNNRRALCARLREGANAIWAMPLRSWNDLAVRAAMACLWNMPNRLGEPAYPDNVIAGDPTRDFDARALAHVVRGILDLSGLKFDAEGRLLPGRTE
jgi:hypothetical protein